jgi:hypothetical protein
MWYSCKCPASRNSSYLGPDGRGVLPAAFCTLAVLELITMPRSPHHCATAEVDIPARNFVVFKGQTTYPVVLYRLKSHLSRISLAFLWLFTLLNFIASLLHIALLPTVSVDWVALFFFIGRSLIKILAQGLVCLAFFAVVLSHLQISRYHSSLLHSFQCIIRRSSCNNTVYTSTFTASLNK